ncbi:MAG: tRNA pseudouridine(55) synthase TruB, partial [Erysipelotrichaceae bacterium]
MSILYIDKPKGMTSFDICFRLRKVLGTKKIGHTGTLDPNATGLMIVLSEKDTKANQFLVSDYKEYIGECLIGIKTDTLDIDGNILEEKTETMPERKEIISVLESFLGDSMQIPPMTSAIKVDGKKLYEYQREGKTVELEPRPITVSKIELLELNDRTFTFRCRVSSGTYI